MKTSLLTFITIISCLLLTACSKSSDLKDLKAYIAKVNQQPAAKVKPLPMFTIPSTDTQATTIKRDPFAPYVNPKTLATRPDAGRAREPLENFPLDALKMLGTVNDGKQLWALIQSPEGLQRIKKGQHIGQNAGQVVKLTTSAITVTELIPEGDGQWGKRTIILTIDGHSA